MDRLKKVRLERAPSQNRFAASIGVPPSVVSDWFADPPKRRPTREQLWRVAKLYGVSLDWLFGFDEVPKDRLDRSQLGKLLPVLREEVLRALADRRTRARPASIERAVPMTDELWETLVMQYKEIAERIDLLQRDIDHRVEIAVLEHIAADTTGRVFDVFPMELHRASSTGEPPLAGRRTRRLTSAAAAAALHALGRKGTTAE